MKKGFKTLLLPIIGVSVLAASAGVWAQQAPKPETLIKWRQSAFQVVAWNSGRIKASLDGKYDKDEVVKAATVIAAVANSGLGGLFPAGSETGKGWHDTAAKPELFKDAKRLGELAGAFSKESTELEKVALNGDAAAVKEQYGKLTRTCKGCHDEFKNKD